MNINTKGRFTEIIMLIDVLMVEKLFYFSTIEEKKTVIEV